MAVITISRQFGAAGLTLGKMLAQKLGYAFIDNEIVQRVAEKAKVSTQFVESIEREAGGRFMKFISGLVSTDFIERVVGGDHGYVDEEIYVDLLHKIITKIAEEDNVVILGRGGQYILSGHENVYHILLVAEKPDRIKFIEKKYKLSARKAAQAVNAEDKRRINLYRKFHKMDYDQPGHYHLVVNTSLLSLEKALETAYCMVIS